MYTKFLIFFKKRGGSVMIESLIAMVLIVVGLLGLFKLIANSASRSMEAVHKLQATYLAAEGIEVVKNILDTNYARGSFSISSGALPNNLNVSYSTTNSDIGTITNDAVFFYNGRFYQSNEGLSQTIFKRTLTISGGGDSFTVTAKVSWKEENGKDFSVTLTDNFYRWRPE